MTLSLPFENWSYMYLFFYVWFDSVRPSQQFFSYVKTGLPGLKQYSTKQGLGQIYPTKLQLNKANSSDTEAQFLDLNLSITNGIVSSKIYDKRDDFNFEIVNFPFLDGNVLCSPSYGIYIYFSAYSFCKSIF